ncbi:MAG TPA: tetratricopeptide repeat protein [Woeseiaceae bacterium]|nr:tetratricopeptide repeat protein [Woeseiaceae bacterium]
MERNGKFWAGMAIFQVAFGLAVFGATRTYYLDDTSTTAAGGGNAATGAATVRQRPAPQPGGISANDIALSSAMTMPSEDPAAMARQADNLFREKQYGRAADLYARLLERNSDNVEARNNLGLTLHYLGRHDEALQQLREGAEANPDHQRIWLTLGFVSSQLGDVEEARRALTRATETGGNLTIKESAQQMLDALPAQ